MTADKFCEGITDLVVHKSITFFSTPAFEGLNKMARKFSIRLFINRGGNPFAITDHINCGLSLVGHK